MRDKPAQAAADRTPPQQQGTAEAGQVAHLASAERVDFVMRMPTREPAGERRQRNGTGMRGHALAIGQQG